MKKLSLFFCALAVSAMAMAAAGPKKTINFVGPDRFGIGADKLKVDSTFTDGVDTIRMIADAKNGYKYNAYQTDTTILFGKKGAALQLSAMNFAVGKIVVYGAPYAGASTVTNIFVGKEAVSTACTGCKGTNTFMIAKAYQAAGNIYQIQVTSSHNAQVSKIEIYEVVEDAPESPVFTPEGGTYISAQTVVLSCPTPGATIEYSYDGSTYNTYTDELVVSSTQTIYAKAVSERGVESEVVSATYKIVTTEGDGTKENPFTVSDMIALGSPKDTAWVTGVIAGTYESSKFVSQAPFTAASNILIANATDTVAVQLVSGTAIRTALNLVDNGSNLGKVLKIKGTLEAYCSTNGLKSPSAYEIEGGTAIFTTKQEKSQAKKMMVNGQMVIVRDGKMYNALGAEL